MSEIPVKSAARGPAPSLRTWGARLLLAVLVPLAVLAGTEGILRWAHVGRDLDLFIPDGAPDTYRTNPYFTALFFPPSFGLKVDNFRLVRHKAPKTFRVFVLGGSAAYGVPEAGFGLAAQLRAQFSALLPGRKVEVDNLAVTAVNSHVVRRIAHEALAFAPDLLVIYMGNNEVVGPYGPGSAINDHLLAAPIVRLSVALRATRLGQAIQALALRLAPATQAKLEWRGLEMFSGHTVAADDPRLRGVYANFRSNLDDILVAAGRAHVPVALCTMAVNLRDCAPFASLHSAGFAAQTQADWQDAMRRAELAVAADDDAGAEAQLQRALRLDPGCAAAHFSLGRVDEALGRRAEAAAEYRAALQSDGLRFRADAAINRIIRDEARRRGVTLVDVARAFGTEPGDGDAMAGSSLFLEHVHFRWEGNYRLGALVAASVVRDRPPLSEPDVAAALGFTEFGRVEMLSLIDEITRRPPFTGQPTYADDRARLGRAIREGDERLGAPGMLEDCARRISEAAALQPDVPFTFFHLASIELWRRDPAAALKANDVVLQLQPPSPENLAQRAYILFALGRHRDAVATLQQSIATYPYYYESYTLLAQIWEQLGQAPAGVAYLRTVLAAMPSTRLVHELLGRLLLDVKDPRGAEQEWRTALALTPDSENALLPLTRLLFAQNRNEDAFAIIRRAFRYNPRNFTVDSLFEQFTEQRGDAGEQADALVALTKSGPVAPAVYLKAGRLLAKLGRRDDAELQLLLARKHARLEGAAAVEDAASAALQQLR